MTPVCSVASGATALAELGQGTARPPFLLAEAAPAGNADAEVSVGREDEVAGLPRRAQ